MSDTPQGQGWWQASDGKYYPPQPQQPPPPPTGPIGPMGPMGPMPPQPKTGMSGCLKAFLIVGGLLLVLGVGSCVVIVLAVDKAADEIDQIDENDAEEARDVGDPDCRLDESQQFMEAEVPVTNSSSERSNYVIEVSFEGSDGSQIETSFTGPSALEPGQSTTDVAHTVAAPPAGGVFTCRVVSVQRFSDELGDG